MRVQNESRPETAKLGSSFAAQQRAAKIAYEQQGQKQYIIKMEILVALMFLVIGGIHRMAGVMGLLGTPILFVAGILRCIIEQIFPFWQKLGRKTVHLILLNSLIGIVAVAIGFLLVCVFCSTVFHTAFFYN